MPSSNDPRNLTIDGAHRAEIDGLRAIAVMLVLGYHAFPTYFPGGFIGVDVFFVISGFLITGIIQKAIARNRFSFVDFYARRARRIFPALAIVLLAALISGYFLLTPNQFESLGREAAASAAFVPNFLFWLEAGYFDASAATKPLLHLWSLGIEEQFYLVWPALLLLLPPRRTGLMLACLLFGSFLYSIFATTHQATAAFYLIPSRAWELGAGAMLAIALSQRHHSAYSNMAVLAGLSIVLTCAFTFNSRQPFPGLLAVPVVVGSMLVVEFGSCSEIAKRLLGGRPIEYLGQVSYPLYLWHWPILVFARLIFDASAIISLAALALSLCLSILTHEAIELPIRRFSITSLRRNSLVATLVLASIGVSGAVCAFYQGLPERLPPNIRAALAYERYDFRTDGRYPGCWLASDKAFGEMAADCIQAGDATIAIWGDSFAARLAAGLRLVFGADRISQYTRNGCPPLVDSNDFPECSDGNKATIESIRNHKPKYLILFADWESLSTNWDVGTYYASRLAGTIQLAKDVGVSNILLLGPTPQFRPSLPSLLFQNWRLSRSDELPNRLMLDEHSTQNLTIQFSRVASVSGITYLPTMNVFCNTDGCLAKVPGTKSDLVSWDGGHLTTPGAKFLAETVKRLQLVSP